MCVYTHAGKTDVLGTEAGQQHTRPEEARDLVGVRMCSSDWEGHLPLLSSARMLEGPLCRPRAVEQRPQARDWVASKCGPTTTQLSLWGARWARSPMAPGTPAAQVLCGGLWTSALDRLLLQPHGHGHMCLHRGTLGLESKSRRPGAGVILPGS